MFRNRTDQGLRGVNPSFIIDTISAKEGELMCFTFKVRDFENLEYITGRIDYDPTVIEFHSLQTIFPDTYKITVESPGVLIFTYEDINSPTLRMIPSFLAMFQSYW